jgi:hypothetical protein
LMHKPLGTHWPSSTCINPSNLKDSEVGNDGLKHWNLLWIRWILITNKDSAWFCYNIQTIAPQPQTIGFPQELLIGNIILETIWQWLFSPNISPCGHNCPMIKTYVIM